MHTSKCLQIPEMVTMIVAGVPLSHKEGDYRATYAALARTCRAFYEPAANALWEDLSDVAPLVRALPQYTWSMSQTGSIKFLCSPAMDEWKRFIANAARVKKLRLSGSKSLKKLLRTISLGLPTGESPFPNLRRLVLKSIEIETMSHASIAIHPGLTGIQIHDCNSAAMCSLLACLGRTCLSLQFLSADCPIPIDAAPIFTRFPSLQTFECPCSGPERIPLPHLAALSTLHSLSTLLPPDSGVRKLDPAVAFKSLRTLKLHGIVSSSTLTLFLRSVSSRTLRDLYMDCDLDPPSGFLAELFDVISTFAALQSLSLNMGTMPVDRDGGSANYVCSLEPLYRLPLLRDLRLNSVVVTPLTNEIIPSLGKIWPDLRNLNFDYSTVQPGDITLEALELFAAYLPKLNNLYLYLDDTVVPSYKNLRARSLIPIHLFLGDSPIPEDSWCSVAAYITSVYPNAVLDTNLEPPLAHGHCWQKIVQIMSVISDVRKEEWERAALGEVTCDQ
ncbi:hypothetical protein PHLGIDRAFT_414883 [Phlebiopsis gigantea 11061_1 CR5-6]|uniref:F-box domain-containing protein n=1 Tax=Phlebiopsis gigantea (strain 11061_1 CR5-6) TaxID=745531 RepID=A0A0C3PLX6_PHLG1|nr:hypothetical protein PHLGIDRAFT_414883 [Phlebiopsis gigantea 11061_1 CR5-6]